MPAVYYPSRKTLDRTSLYRRLKRRPRRKTPWEPRKLTNIHKGGNCRRGSHSTVHSIRFLRCKRTEADDALNITFEAGILTVQNPLFCSLFFGYAANISATDSIGRKSLPWCSGISMKPYFS
jgi:hypothetical protein